MKKVEVRILGLSYSQTQVGSYVVVLAETKGARKLPIIIKPADAQIVALKLENMKTQRPLTHDLFKSLTDGFNIDVNDIFISNLVEGVFYAKINTSNHIEEFSIESTIGDAIALALVYDCPIYVAEYVMASAGIFINDDGTNMSPDEINEFKVEEEETKPTQKKAVSVDDLKEMLGRAVANEEYEVASTLRDRIKELESK
jgi:uncharacterized protein